MTEKNQGESTPFPSGDNHVSSLIACELAAFLLQDPDTIERTIREAPHIEL